MTMVYHIIIFQRSAALQIVLLPIVSGQYARFAAKFHKTNGGQFMRAQGGIFRVQIHNLLSDGRRQFPLILLGNGWSWLWRQ